MTDTDHTAPTWVVYRHAIPAHADPFTLPIYPDADIVHVGVKFGDGPWGVHLWERHRTDLVRPQAVPRRTFQVVATGEKHSGVYCGTFIRQEFVFHLVELEDAS